MGHGFRYEWSGVFVLLWSLLLPAAWTADAAPVGEVDQLQACLDCHDLEAELAAAVAHAPAREGDCTACHNPHASRFAGLLQARPGPLCISCHGELEAELALAEVHAPVAEGRCADCHEPHGGGHDKLLVAERVELCISCHEDVAAWQGQAVRHSPFRRENCFLCHQPHAGAFPQLSKRPMNDTCAECHPRDADFTSAHQGYPVELADCGQCHDPHASSRADLLGDNLHLPFEDGDCADCHGPPGTAQPFRVELGQDQLCGDCHDDVVEASRNAPFPHVSAGGGDCTACHNPHAGDDGLLQQPLERLCLSCHDPGGAASGQPGRYAGHGGSTTCATCHDSHGGERPLLLVDDVVPLCNTCHAHQHAASHPMGEQARDPRNGQPMDCLSCHAIHDAPYPDYMHLDGDRELCISCHTDLARDRR